MGSFSDEYQAMVVHNSYDLVFRINNAVTVLIYDDFNELKLNGALWLRTTNHQKAV